MSPVSPESDLLQPLREIYGDAGRSLPHLEVLPGTAVPEPYRGLLVHDRDMTRTLEAHHGDGIRLRTWASGTHDGIYRRMVALELEHSGRPVEFGATRVHLERFPEPWRGLILAGERPLGGILNAWGIAYRSRPSAFFRTDGDERIWKALGLSGPATLYGRRNTLSDPQGVPLADILEILPP
jgi:chorismate-pyruvate lyase